MQSVHLSWGGRICIYVDTHANTNRNTMHASIMHKQGVQKTLKILTQESTEPMHTVKSIHLHACIYISQACMTACHSMQVCNICILLTWIYMNQNVHFCAYINIERDMQTRISCLTMFFSLVISSLSLSVEKIAHLTMHSMNDQVGWADRFFLFPNLRMLASARHLEWLIHNVDHEWPRLRSIDGFATVLLVAAAWAS